MKIKCCICYSSFLKTSNYQSSKTFGNFMTNLTKFFNSANSNSCGPDEKDSIDLGKSSENMFCCDQCSPDIQIFCDMLESRELLVADIIGLLATISNLIKPKQSKICQTINCLVCQSESRKKTKVPQQNSRVVERCKHFKLLLKRFLSNTKKPLFAKGILKEMSNGDDYCCDECLPTIETFCEIYHAIDSVQIELFRLLDKIFNNVKTKCGGEDVQNIPIFWQDVMFKVEHRRKRHYPRLALERLHFPKEEVSNHVKVEANVNSHSCLETMAMHTLKLEPAYHESEAQSSLVASHCFNHSTETMPTDVKSEKITMEFEPDIVTMSKFKTEREIVTNDEVGKQTKRKVRIRPKGRQKKYQCLFCHSKYLHPGPLEKHIKTHTGEKTYICRICLEEFRDRRTFFFHRWKIHRHLSCKGAWMRFRKKVFQCNLCERRCYNRSDLVIHHQCVHSNERLFSCEICGVKFKTKYSLWRHNRTRHDG